MGNESIFAQSIALNNKSLKNKVKEKEDFAKKGMEQGEEQEEGEMELED